MAKRSLCALCAVTATALAPTEIIAAVEGPSRWAVAAAPLVAAGAAALALNALDEDGAASDWDQSDPGRWKSVYDAWALGRGAELGRRGSTIVESRANNNWRVLLRHGSIQSVTAWDPLTDAPRHSVIANEYIKTMACCAVGARRGALPTKALFLGLGAGTLPSLLLHENADYVAVELDEGAAELATEYLGLQGVDVRIGDALDHSTIAPGRYDLIALDVYDETNNVPRPFCDRAFADGIANALSDDGVFVANFHVGSADEDARADRAARAYQSAFGELLAAPVRYQGNRVFVAGADVVEADAVAAAERLGWPFDPRSRLRRLERVS